MVSPLPRRLPPSRINWHALDGHHGARATELNNRTFELFAEFVRRHGSVKPGHRGATLTAGYISGVVSTLRALRSRTAGFDMRDPQANLRLPSQFKDMRREDGPRAPDTSLRARREGFRAQHFAAAAAGGFDRHSRAGVSRWCAMHSGHNGVARGGDLSGVARASDPFDPLRGTTCHEGEGGIEFVDLEETGTGLPGLFLWIFPCKDTNRTHVKHPVPISARSLRVFDADYDDPLDPYLAILREWRCMLHEVPPSRRAATPFFRRAGSAEPLLTSDLAACIGEAWAAAGVTAPHSLDFAHDVRICGACDIRDQHGLHGRELLRQRGRWAKDIGWIYAHVSATQHFQASVDMGSSTGRSIQSLATSWVHPAVTPQWDDGRDRHR